MEKKRNCNSSVKTKYVDKELLQRCNNQCNNAIKVETPLFLNDDTNFPALAVQKHGVSSQTVSKSPLTYSERLKSSKKESFNTSWSAGETSSKDASNQHKQKIFQKNPNGTFSENQRNFAEPKSNCRSHPEDKSSKAIQHPDVNNKYCMNAEKHSSALSESRNNQRVPSHLISQESSKGQEEYQNTKMCQSNTSSCGKYFPIAQPTNEITNSKRIRKSKIKKQGVFQSGKIRVLTPEFHSKITQQANTNHIPLSQNWSFDINNSEDYPELGKVKVPKVKTNLENQKVSKNADTKKMQEQKTSVVFLESPDVKEPDKGELIVKEEKTSKANISSGPRPLLLFDMFTSAKPKVKKQKEVEPVESSIPTTLTKVKKVGYLRKTSKW